MIFVIDNYDSFVHNLARYIRIEGGETHIARNDAISADEALALSPEGVVVSPGPKMPKDAGVSLELIKRLPLETPFLGVCLGHQCLIEAFGGTTARATRPLHGEASTIHHDGTGVLSDLPSPIQVGRYHSLISRLPSSGVLTSCAWDDNDQTMAVRHVARPWFGVQFHPESLLTMTGRAIIKNFVRCCKR